MDHSLGALLAQNNDQGHEQAIYYLSRTMIWTLIQPYQKRMLCIGIRCPEDVTLLGKTNHTHQSFKIAYDEAIITEWSIRKMGHTALPIWDAIPATKSCEGIGSGRLLGWVFGSKNNQTLWRSPRWGQWSLLDLDVFRRTGVVTLLRRRIKNGSSRKYHSRSWGSTYHPTELCNPSCILINWGVFQ